MSLSLVQEPPSSPWPESLALHARPAEFRDALAIHRLIDSLSFDGTLLPRPYMEICRNIDTFTVVESELQGFLGCAALHVYGPHLAEVCSIAVLPEARGGGAGAELVEALLAQARHHNIPALCLFTRIPGFFARFGFRVIERQIVTEKVAKDCRNCGRNSCCDETAMLLGRLPPRFIADSWRDLVQINSNKAA